MSSRKNSEEQEEGEMTKQTEITEQTEKNLSQADRFRYFRLFRHLSSMLLWCCAPGVIGCLFGLTASAQQDEKKEHYQSPGTKRMGEMLRRIYQAQDWKTDPNRDAERADYYREGLKQKLDARTELKARLALADALLRAGQSAEAVGELERLRQMTSEQGIILAPFFLKEFRQLLAVSWLRVGEQENCLLQHGRESCIFPIRGSGVHQLRRGSTGAVRELTALLADDPGNLSARWLLNVAYMTLGEYPQSVPPQWLIKPETFASEYDIRRFNDVASAVGLNITGHAGGSVLEDFDGDGLLDLMVSSQGPLDQLRFFRNRGDGTFTEGARAAGLTGEIGGLNITHTDYNNDGVPDVLVLRGGWWGEHGNYPASLLRGHLSREGEVRFDDVTEEAGLMSLHPTQTAAWADYDNDGWLDLFIGHESSVQERHPSQLFHNNRNGTFTEVGEKSGLADLGFVKGVAWGDYNNDGRPDLYVSIKGQKNRLFRNDGPPRADKSAWKFTDVTAQAGVGEPLHSFATWFCDYDNDGWQDLLVAGFYTETANDLGAFELGLPHRGETPRLYRNNGNGSFTDVTSQVRLDRVILAMGAGFGDLDNDGWLDFYFGTGTPEFSALLPNRMFRNANGRVFQDVTTSGGFGHLQKGHGVSFGDIDNDGDEDVFEVIGGAYPGDTYQSVLFENPGHGNHWLSLQLVGKQSNAAAIGARVRITVNTPEGTRNIFRAISSGGSFGDSPFRLHVGLGRALAIKEVAVKWPTSGRTQQFGNLSLNHHYRIREGEPEATETRLPRFSISPAKSHQHHQPEK
jgi:hypothetical protein